MIKLSYILPVYNVERYIASCLDSIFEQDLPEECYEVVCVDDCSPDQSIRVIESFMKKHSNIVMVRHEKNKKAGGARNTGINVSKGEYIWFVDPDDTIAHNSTSVLLNKCESHHLDVLCFNSIIVSDNKQIQEKIFSDEMVSEKAIDFLCDQFGERIINYMGYPWRCLYRRKLLLDKGIYFPEEIIFGEDTTFMVEAISNADRIGSTTEYAYRYRQNNISASAQLHNLMRGDLIYQSCIIAGKMVIRCANQIQLKSELLASYVRKGLPWFVNRLFIRVLRTNSQERKRFFAILCDAKRDRTLPLEVVSYMDLKNRVIIKYPKLSSIIIEGLSSVYKIAKS